MHKTETTKSLLPFNWVLPFPNSLFTENHSARVITSSVSAHLGGSQNPSRGEVQEVWWRSSHLGQAQESLPGAPCHTPRVAQQNQDSPLLQSVTQPATSTQYRSPQSESHFPSSLKRTNCISWAAFAAALGLSLTPMESAPNQEPCFAQI